MSDLKTILVEVKIRIYQRMLLHLANFVTVAYPLPMSGLKIFFLRLMGISIAAPCFVDKGFDCVGPKNISIGKCCSFGHNNKFWAFNKITIGPYVQTALGLTLVAGGHRTDDYSPLIEKQEIILEGENWIGANVTIIGGVTVGRGTIIAAGAVVTKDTPRYSIIGGVPAKVIRARTFAESVVSPFGEYRPMGN